MQFIRKQLDAIEPLFEKGGKFEKLYALYEAQDTILFTPSSVTKGLTHIRDHIDQKRMMITVVVALLPCMLMAMWNTGYQALGAVGAGAGWSADFNTMLFSLIAGDTATLDAAAMSLSPLWCALYGALYWLPVYIVTMTVGGLIEVAVAIIRGHEISEGFLVTGALFPLILPPTIPLWQVGLGIAFGVIIGKEVFGGVGMNILNPALTGRAFLFFAYPAQISGNMVWTAATANDASAADGFTGATWLANGFSPDGAAAGAEGVYYTAQEMVIHGATQADVLASLTWMDAFIGTIPGSMGETSALACLIGAVILLVTRVGAWQTMVGCVVGTVAVAALLNVIGSDTNAMFSMPFYWHMVLGGWAFGMVFMATDPVSSAFTDTGKLMYGLGIGIVVVLVRVVNPAYPEGMMLAILFMNLFAPLFDHFVIQANIKRRAARYAAAS